MTRVVLIVVFLLFARLGYAADYPVILETIWPSQNDVTNTPGNGKKLLENQWESAISSLTDSQDFVVSGCDFTTPGGTLNINVTGGCKAMVSGRYISFPGAIGITATPNLTNYVFLKLTRDGANLVTGAVLEVNVSGIAPADSVPIGTLVAGPSSITSTSQSVMPFGMPSPPPRGPVGTGSGSTRTHEGSVTISASQNLGGTHFYSDFTCNSGVTITVPDGARQLVIIASRSITINCTIDAVGAGAPGGVGVASSAGGAGTSSTDQAAGNGGTGNSGGTTSGGGGGDVLVHGSLLSGSAQVSGTSTPAIPGFMLSPWTAVGGAGGGAGGGGTSTGGNGGSGGGTIGLLAPTVTLGATAVLNTSGQNGNTTPGNNGGGGGGGGAGNIYIHTRTYNNSGATFTQNGGSGASGLGTATAGSAGTAGVKQILLW